MSGELPKLDIPHSGFAGEQTRIPDVSSELQQQNEKVLTALLAGSPAENAFRRDHAKLLKGGFRGQWVVYHNETMVAYATTQARAVGQVKGKHPPAECYVARVDEINASPTEID